MIAKKCDRCKKLYEEYNIKNDKKNINGIEFLNIDSEQRYFSHGPYDLCPECSNQLTKWFSEGNINGVDKACEDKLIRIVALVFRINSTTDYRVRLTNYKKIVRVCIYNASSDIVSLEGYLENGFVGIGNTVSTDDIIAVLEELYGGNE